MLRIRQYFLGHRLHYLLRTARFRCSINTRLKATHHFLQITTVIEFAIDVPVAWKINHRAQKSLMRLDERLAPLKSCECIEH